MSKSWISITCSNRSIPTCLCWWGMFWRFWQGKSGRTTGRTCWCRFRRRFFVFESRIERSTHSYRGSHYPGYCYYRELPGIVLDLLPKTMLYSSSRLISLKTWSVFVLEPSPTAGEVGSLKSLLPSKDWLRSVESIFSIRFLFADPLIDLKLWLSLSGISSSLKSPSSF